jgi:hypothetical protein
MNETAIRMAQIHRTTTRAGNAIIFGVVGIFLVLIAEKFIL